MVRLLQDKPEAQAEADVEAVRGSRCFRTERTMAREHPAAFRGADSLRPGLRSPPVAPDPATPEPHLGSGASYLL